MKYLACDFGGSSLKYALVTDEAVLEQSQKRPAPLNSTEEFIETVGELYDQYSHQIAGIAISMPGYIDPIRGELFESGAYRPLYGKNIPELLQARCPVRISVENDGKCAALAEAWKGSLSDCRDGVMLVLGSAIGGGLIKDGKVHAGRGFTAGELSYLITDPKQYNDLGCAYMSVGAYGLTYRICKQKNLDLTVQDSAPMLTWLDSKLQLPYVRPDAPLQKIKANGTQFFTWLEQGDPDAVKVYQNFIHTLAIVVHNVQICYAPDKISIGGGLSLQERIFSDLEQELRRYYAGMGLGKQLHARVVKSRYRSECNLVGAVYHFIQRFENQASIDVCG